MIFIYHSIISICLQYLWTAPFIFTILFGFRLRIISDNRLINELSNKCFTSSYHNDTGPSGILIGRYFIALAYGDGENPKCCLLIRDKQYMELKGLSEVSKLGRYSNMYVTGRSNCYISSHKYIKLPSAAYEWQNNIVEEVKNTINDRESITILIAGESGRGKSTLAGFIAAAINGTCVSNYRVSGSLELVRILDLVKDIPVIKIDEFDSMLESPYNKITLPDAYDKASWNTLIDNINDGVFGKVVVVATTNKRLSEFDPSMVGHRFTIKLELF